ncbi:AraC family transcriptional regulator [Lacihabitans sp. LS3-19]|uniref:AraC family transcriptional regulator n=1 Tax=Lacihabitans sp. LS3-19 TaxID=2487335 RepID=UPI0020CB82A7|nr:AraC family transcriptional regulator [Lacihabitans sp. LS3-19]MCP9769866.1 AraC family transcriptional regulator [Lacihabitans sp. LS3-19]
MPIVLEKNIESQLESITVLDLKEKHFDPNWHFHPHYQLFTVLKGTGTRFIGDNIQHFEEGDTVFLGPNLPHLWRSDKQYFDADSKDSTHGIVLYFSEDFLGENFFEKPEMKPLKVLLENSKRGIYWSDNLKEKVIDFLKEIPAVFGFERVLKLLELLHSLSQNTDFKYITNPDYANSYKISETERMQKVYDFVSQSFKENIKLNEIADKVNMTEAAFCRYFKKRTNKTFVDFVNEIRIGNACKLLKNKEMSIAEIAFESGFNTMSNFHFQFKKVTSQTPNAYLKANIH